MPQQLLLLLLLLAARGRQHPDSNPGARANRSKERGLVRAPRDVPRRPPPPVPRAGNSGSGSARVQQRTDRGALGCRCRCCCCATLSAEGNCCTALWSNVYALRIGRHAFISRRRVDTGGVLLSFVLIKLLFPIARGNPPAFVEQKRDSADEPQNADTASALPHDDDDDLSVGSHGADGDREPSFVHARGKPAA
ncbi:unnamed protein product [Lampetra planeri]